jgi:PKD repeat protein
MKKIILCIFVVVLANSLWCNSGESVKVNDLSISFLVNEILSNKLFLNSLSENFGEDIKQEVISELQNALDTDFSNYDFGEIRAIQNLNLLAKEQNNLDLSEDEYKLFIESLNTVPLHEIIPKQYVGSNDTYDFYKYLSLSGEDDGRSVIGSVLVYMVLSGAIHAGVECIGLIYEYNGNPLLIPTNEWVTALVTGFVGGFVSGGFDVVALMIGGPMGGAASFLDNLISSPGFSNDLENLIEEPITAMLGPIAYWTFLDYYNPQNYVDLFTEYPTTYDSISDSCAVALEDYINLYGEEIIAEGNVIACETWTFNESSQYNQVQINFNNYEFINFGMSFILLEDASVTIELQYGDGITSIPAASGNQFIEEGDHVAIMSSGLLGQNIIDNLGYSDEYIVEGFAETFGTNAYIDYVNEDNCGHFSIIVAGSPIFTNGSVTPQTGDPNTNFNFFVTYTDPANQAPDFVDLIVDDNTYPMSGSGTWCSGVEFTTTQQFSVGSYYYYFEGYANGQYLRFPATSELIFEVEPLTGDGITLSFSQNPFIENQIVQISATINPTMSNYPINFLQYPEMGYYFDENPIYTNANGVATVDYWPMTPGEVTIRARDANDPTNDDIVDVDILPEPPDEFTIFISTSYISGDENSAVYEAFIRVYESDGDEATYEDGTITTDLGLFSNGLSTIDFTTDHHGRAEENIYFNVQGTCNLIVQVGNSVESHQFDVVFVPPVYQINPFHTISDGDMQSFDWSPVDSDILFYNTSDEEVASYSIAQQQIVNSQVIESNDADIHILRISPNGSRIAISSKESGNNYIKIYDIGTGNYLAERNGLNPSFPSSGNIDWITDSRLVVADGSIAYSTGFASEILTYTESTTLQIYTLQSSSWDPSDASYGGNKCAISYMDDDNHDGIVKVWNSNGGFLFNIDPHPNATDDSKAVDVSEDGTRIAVQDDENSLIKIYDGNGSLLHTLSTGDQVNNLCWNPNNNRYLITYNINNEIVYLWDLLTVTKLCEYNANGEVHDICWSSDGNMFGILLEEQCIKLFNPWDIEGPSISIISPSDSSSTQQQNITINGFVNDNSGVSSLQCKVNNGDWEDVTVTGNQFSHNVSLSEGLNTITLQAQDNYYNQSQCMLHVTRLIDGDPPFVTSPEISNSNPEIGEQITFSALIQDGWTGVDATTVISFVHNPDSTFVQSYPMFDDGTNGDITPGDDIYTCTINTDSYLEMQYLIDVIASDYNSNVVFENNIITFNPFDLPEFADFIIQPDIITISDSVTITVTISDQSGIINSILYYDSEPMGIRNGILTEFKNNYREIGITMLDMGNSQYQATIPPQNESYIYFFIEAMDGLGNSGNSVVQTYSIIDILLADFSAIPDTGCAPLHVQFNDTSTGSPISWEWDFQDDGTIDRYEQNPEWIYNESGIYTVSLTVSDGINTDTEIKTNYITVSGCSAFESPTNLTTDLDNQTGEVELNWQYDSGGGSYEDFEDGIANDYLFNEPEDRWNVDDGYLKFTGQSLSTNGSAYWDNEVEDFTMEFEVQVIRYDNGDYTFIQGWTTATNLLTGFGVPNIVTIVAAGADFELYFNGVLEYSFTDAVHYSGFCNVIAYDISADEVWFDYVNIMQDTRVVADISNFIPVTGNTVIGGDENHTPGNISNISSNHFEVDQQCTYTKVIPTRAFQDFKIYRDESEIGTTTDTTFVDSLPDYGTYEYEVTAYYDEGESVPSNSVEVEWSSQTGDTIDDPFLVEYIDDYYTDSGSTVAFNDDYDIPNIDNNDVVYMFTLDVDMIVDISLLQSTYDTQLTIYSDDVIPGPSNYLYHNDDYIGRNQSYSLSAKYSVLEETEKSKGRVLQSAIYGMILYAGSYFAIVDGYGSSMGDYVIEITVDEEINGLIPPTNLSADLDAQTGEVELNWQYGSGGGSYEDFEDGIANDYLFNEPQDRWNVDDGYLKFTGQSLSTNGSAYWDNEVEDFTMEFEVQRFM